MPKFVIETVRVLRTKYYVEAPEAEWACDAITMEEVQQFSDVFHMEDIASIQEVDEYPVAGPREGVNGATYVYNKETTSWDEKVRFDLDPRHPLRNEK